MPTKFTFASKFMNASLEDSILSALMKNPETYWDIIDILPPEAWTAGKRKFEQLAEAIEHDRTLPPIEIKGEPAKKPVEVARQLADLYQKRLLASSLQESLDNLKRDGKPALELISDLENRLSLVQQSIRDMEAGRVVALSSLFGEVVQEAYDRHEAMKKSGTVAIGIPTGIKKLDKLLGGLQTGIHLLAGEPGQGKTSFVLQVAGNVSREGFPVLFISFEESLKRLALKAVCQVAGLESKKFMDGYGEPEELRKAVLDYGRELSGIYLIMGNSKLTVSGIKAKALQIMTKRNAKKCLIVIDYLQRWASSRRDFSDFRHVVGGLVSDLREVSNRLESPVLIISSQNRGGQGEARLTSLKESGDLEYSADTAIFLVKSGKREAEEPARAIDLVIRKNRYGDIGKVELIFRPDFGTFREGDWF